MTDVHQGITVDLPALSSGEKALVALATWLYSSKVDGLLPRLLLLDEPDAHLHPSMVPGLLDALQHVLVGKYGAQVIMTTHRAETVALAPDDSIFEMRRDPGPGRVHRVTDRRAAVRRLTSSIVSVLKGTRIIFVEGDLDIEFYRVVVDALARNAQMQDGANLEFRQSAYAAKGGDQGGGWRGVRESVEKFQGTELAELVHGVEDADDDASRPAAAGVHRLSRYSVENYLLDPVVIFAVLRDAGRAPTVAGVPALAIGDEAKLRSMDAEALQAIAEHILAPVEANLPKPDPSERARFECSFGPSVSLRYPVWLRQRPGRALRDIMQQVHGPVVQDQTLLKAFTKLRLVPDDLAAIINRIATA